MKRTTGWKTRVLIVLGSLLVVLASLWGVLALGYQLPLAGGAKITVQALWCVVALAMLVLLWRGRPGAGMIGFAVLFAILLFWWSRLEPSNDRLWADDLAQMTFGTVQGTEVTLNNVRNFAWRSEDDYRQRWETRRFDLQQLASVDLITSYWGLPAIAHVLVSFGFEDGRFITFSVEIRKEKGEKFSEIGGFFKEFELSIVATDERDAVRVRSNVRGEDVYLYRVNMPKAAMRELFLSYVEQANRLTREPRFYHTITGNCTTIVFEMMRHIIDGLPMDYRLLLSGYLPGYVEEVGGLMPGHDLDTLRSRGRITDRAIAAGDSADFSRLIRQGVPGWESLGADGSGQVKQD